MSDELAEAERWLLQYFDGGDEFTRMAGLVMAEYDRLLDVEHAAALLLDACDAREAAGMTTGAAEVRQFLRDVRRAAVTPVVLPVTAVEEGQKP